MEQPRHPHERGGGPRSEKKRETGVHLVPDSKMVVGGVGVGGGGGGGGGY